MMPIKSSVCKGLYMLTPWSTYLLVVTPKCHAVLAIVVVHQKFLSVPLPTGNLLSTYGVVAVHNIVWTICFDVIQPNLYCTCQSTFQLVINMLVLQPVDSELLIDPCARDYDVYLTIR